MLQPKPHVTESIRSVHMLTRIVFTILEKARPVLVKLLPIKLLRSVKKQMVESAVSSTSLELLPFLPDVYPQGVNLVGYIQGEIGLGQSCRLVAQGLQATGLDFVIYNYQQVSAMRFKDNSWTHKITSTTPYNINILHINPYEMPLAFMRMGRQLWDKRYNIAFWLWELENFPPEWENAFSLVDEIWTPSEFVSQSIRKATTKPVKTIPYALAMPECGGYTREHFGLPNDKTLFLCMYDCNSTMERKNPMGVIRTFKQAFSGDDNGVGLVIKVNNPQKQDLQLLKAELEGYPNTWLIPEVLDKAEVNALIASADVFVSLHRAEGFGLVMAEAMLLGTPVITTNWSSNTEFMNSNVACMVDYNLITIQQDYGQYKAGNRWADPNIKQAADFMKKLNASEAFRAELAAKAKAHIQEHLSPDKAAVLIKDRITEIYATSRGKENV